MRIKLPHDTQKIAEMTGNKKYVKAYNNFIRSKMKDCGQFIRILYRLDLNRCAWDDLAPMCADMIECSRDHTMRFWDPWFYPLKAEILFTPNEEFHAKYE